MALEVEGLDELNAALTKLAKGAVPDAVSRASFAAGLVIQKEAQDNTPVEYGFLRASAYTKKEGAGSEVGFIAGYAIYVHENMEQTLKGVPRPSGLGTYWNPGGPKFLERAVNENGAKVRDIFEAYLRGVIDDENSGT